MNFISLALHNVAWVAMLFDFGWRAHRSVRLVAKYWGRASVGLPLIDLRVESDLGGRVCSTLGNSPAKLCGSIFLSPFTGLSIVAVGLLLLINLATALYWPTYFHYVNGCINPPRNGTLLSQNLYSVSFNYAASDGNKALARRMDAFHSRRAANCSAELRDSANEQVCGESWGNPHVRIGGGHATHNSS